jgi:hypothetical protein
MTSDLDSMELPKFISVDDHVVEPARLWQDRLPSTYLEQGPRTVRQKGRIVFDPVTKKPDFILGDGPDDRWCDVWYYEGTCSPLRGDLTAVGPLADAVPTTAVTFDDMLPGCFDQAHRLADMDLNHTRPVCASRPSRAFAGNSSSRAPTRSWPTCAYGPTTTG